MCAQVGMATCLYCCEYVCVYAHAIVRFRFGGLRDLHGALVCMCVCVCVWQVVRLRTCLYVVYVFDARVACCLCVCARVPVSGYCQLLRCVFFCFFVVCLCCCCVFFIHLCCFFALDCCAVTCLV